jgi:homoserine kinase type II
VRFPDDVLAEHGGLVCADVRPHHGGMNSATWFVRAGRERFVAKAAVGWFPGGVAVADALAERGFASGAPVRTRDGRLTVEVGGDQELALLTFVDGRPLTAADQHAIGTTLGEVHRLLRDVTVEGAVGMDWIDLDAAHLGLRPWLRGAVAGAVRDLAAAGPFTCGLLHADPAPEAFIGGGLIDWGAAMRGPLLYDVASALMYLGGDGGTFLTTYLQAGLVPEEELRRALPVLLRFRFAVQADYFARRLAANDLTGIAGAAENEQGLEDARRGLDRMSHS